MIVPDRVFEVAAAFGLNSHNNFEVQTEAGRVTLIAFEPFEKVHTTIWFKTPYASPKRCRMTSLLIDHLPTSAGGSHCVLWSEENYNSLDVPLRLCHSQKTEDLLLRAFYALAMYRSEIEALDTFTATERMEILQSFKGRIEDIKAQLTLPDGTQRQVEAWRDDISKVDSILEIGAFEVAPKSN